MSTRHAKKRKHDLDHDTSEKHRSSERHQDHDSPKKSRRRKPSDSPEPSGNGNTESLSMEETNKLRASLGLAPLEVDDAPKIRDSESGDPKEKIVTEDGMDFVHKPSENLAHKKQADKLKEKLEVQKQKRIVQSKLKTKGLADSSSDEDESAESWVEKQRRLAEQKAREIEEMDEEAQKPTSAPIRKTRKPGTARPKESSSLAGMTIGHSKEAFLTGEEQILVLDDRNVLDDDGEEVLINPTLMYGEQLKKNRDVREKKSGYNPYDEEEIDEFGVVKRKDLLSKYDDGVDGPRTRETFKLDEHGGVDVNREAAELQQKRIQFMANKQLQSLETPKYKIASEFYTEEEMISFRKPKKKKDGSKTRKRKGLKADDLQLEPDQETPEERKAREERLKARRHANGEPTESNGNGKSKDSEVKMEVDIEEGEIKDEFPVIKRDRFKDTMGATVDKSKMHSLLNKIKKREEEDDEEEEDFAPMTNLTGVVIDDEVEDELSTALEKSRKLRAFEIQKEKESADSGTQVKQMLSRLKHEPEDEMDVDAEADDDGQKQVVFDSTSEYYKTIGNIPTIGLAGNRDDDVDYSELIAEQANDLAEKEKRLKARKREKSEDDSEEERKRRKKEKKRSHKEKDRHHKDTKVEAASDGKHRHRERERDADRKHRRRERSPTPEQEDEKMDTGSTNEKYENVLGKEADVTKGVAGMLRLAGEKGYLDDPNAKRNRGGTLKHLESKLVAKVEFSKYDIEDKYLKKMERMGTTGSGPLRAFPDKRDYQPKIEITYSDAQGRDMDEKAAFRALSHKFHGKAPGKKQIEKRMRQQDKKEKLKKMNSSDTPLGTLSKQIKKQEQLGSHYLVLSGARNDPNAPLQKD